MKNWLKGLTLTGVVLITLTGCMSTSKGSTWETREQGADETALVVQRPSSYAYSRFFMDVVLDKGTDNERSARLDNGKEIRMIVPNGQHTLTVVLAELSTRDVTPKETGNTTTFTASSSPITYSLSIKGSALTTVQYVWDQK